MRIPPPTDLPASAFHLPLPTREGVVPVLFIAGVITMVACVLFSVVAVAVPARVAAPTPGGVQVLLYTGDLVKAEQDLCSLHAQGYRVVGNNVVGDALVVIVEKP